MSTFYMTYARSRPKDIVPYAEENKIGLMTNAAHRWSNTTRKFNKLWGYDTRHIVDSGGYNVQSNFGMYPWTVKHYHYWLSQNNFNWAAVMDYACEERFDELHSVQERMQKTVDNTVEHFNLDPQYNLLPVLQGRSVEDYVKSYDMLKDHGIPLEKVGLGTVCRISSSKEIVRTEKAIRDRCKDIEYIHGFGVKINAFKLGATFDSADSQAWVYPASNGRCYTLENGKLGEIAMGDDSRTRTVESFKNYYAYVTKLMGEDIEFAETSRYEINNTEYMCGDCDYPVGNGEVIKHGMDTGHSINVVD